MRPDDLMAALGLEKKHYDLDSVEVPVIDSHLYTTLGRRLFELYEKYSVASEDQRDFERLSFILTCFTAAKTQKTKSPLKKIRAKIKRALK